jgi:2-polyprenyl-6-hydroxyphenyl methylase/3-demethylubiquinone-9 3-methyltransferase
MTTDAQQRFAFGANWLRFLRVVDERRIAEAQRSLAKMIGDDAVSGRSFLDIGSGSGLSSLAAARLGAARVHSFDFDRQSVACTEEMKRRFAPAGVQWTVERGDVLDPDYVKGLGTWDVVYSWGVLHHTGRMWDAIANAAELVADDGLLFIAIYNDQGEISRFWTVIKRLYNAGAVPRALVSSFFIGYWAARGLLSDLLRLRNPLRRYREYSSTRGMSMVHDWIDWLGGFPFEVAKPEEIFRFLRDRGFTLRNMTTWGAKMGCNEFIFQRTRPGEWR